MTALIGRLETLGHVRAAAEPRERYGRIDGLTDGWAMFLGSVASTQVKYGRDLPAEDAEAL